MSSAKPQSTGEPDASDDLIAELAKLMAQDAQGPSSSAPSSPVPPAQPPKTIQPAAPAAAAPLHVPTSAAVRIPGMIDTATPMPSQTPAASAPAGDAGFKFDFGLTPKAPPVVTPPPLDNWQDRINAQPAERREPELAPAPPRQQQAEPLHVPTPVAPPSHTPSLSALAAHPVAPEPAPVQSHPGDLNFDFGIGLRREPTPEPALHAQPEPVAEEKPETVPEQVRPTFFEAPETSDDDHDAIADLIAAELSGGEPIALAAETVEALIGGPAIETEAEIEAEPEIAQAAEEPPAPKPSHPLIRPVNFAANKQLSDKFTIAPVFGVGTRATQSPQAPRAEARPTPSVGPANSYRVEAPQPPRSEPAFVAAPEAKAAPAPAMDPFDEIENLIGEAVRVELSAPAKPQPAARAEPKLSFDLANHEPNPAPRGRQPAQPAISADEAILAAAAVTGAHIAHVGDSVTDNPKARKKQLKAAKAAKEPKEPRMPRERSGNGLRPFIGPAVAGTLLLVAGLGLYWVLGMGHTDGTAPVLTADGSPTKQAPAVPDASTNPTQGSVVFEEIDGTANPSVEQLVSRDQSSDVATAEPTTVDTTEAGLANRKVRTVTVRPDGSIVSSDDVVAGSEALPVARPNVPAVPGTPEEATTLLADTNATVPTTTTPADTTSPLALTGDPATAAVPPATETTPVTTPTTTMAAIDPAELDPNAPIPMPALTNRPNTPIGPTASATNAVNAVIDPATQTPAAAAQPDIIGNLAAGQPATATPNSSIPIGAPAYVQLSSQRDEATARQSLNDIQAKYGSLFNGTPLEVQRIDLGAKGIYYRVRLPAVSLSSANTICADVKTAGGDCFAQN